MREQVFLTQLYKSSSTELIMATCHVRDTEDDDRFECRIKGDKQYKEQLWQFVKGNWNGLTCEIEFDDVTSTGAPKHAVIIKVNGFNKISL